VKFEAKNDLCYEMSRVPASSNWQIKYKGHFWLELPTDATT